MKKNIKNTLIILTILLLVLIWIISKNTSVQATDNGSIKMNIKLENFEPGGNVAIEILLQDQKQGISSFTTYFHYDETIFEEINSSNITTNVSEDDLDTIAYSSKTGKITIYYNEDISDLGTICTINLKIKDDVDLSNITEFVTTLGKVETYSFDYDNLVDYGTISETTTIGQKPEERLYLSSESYKIGNNDINNYEEGDKYISRIKAETTLKDYINNLNTNGIIKVIKEDGTELTENEYVGTGMTLTVTKDEEKIELKIAVMGDLDGSGTITATDLSTLNQTILKIVTLENEYKIAADLDENDNLTATDLSTLNQMLLKVL